MESNGITVGVAARRSGLSPKALRLYESMGILGPVGRSPGGYRTYNDSDVELLRFVRRARALGFRLSEIAAIVDRRRRGLDGAGIVTQMLEGHINSTEQQLSDLSARRSVLQEILQRARSAAEGGRPVHLCRLTDSPHRPLPSRE
jgi:DNA-binding transcriptional MerR regulator